MKIKIISKKKFEAAILITAFLISLIFLNSKPAEATSEEETIMVFSFQEPLITEVNISNITYHKVTMNDTQVFDLPGIPLLPVKPLKILLPQNGTIDSINVSYEENISLGTGYKVMLGTEQTDFNSSQQNQSNITNFNTSLPYPTELFSNLDIQFFRGYKVLLLNLYPVHYINNTGEIYYYKNMTVSIKTNDSGSPNPYFRNLSKDKNNIINTLEIENATASYTTLPSSCNSSLVPSNEDYQMVIITRKKFKESHSYPLKSGRGDNTFLDLAEHKTDEMGIKTTVVYAEDIYEQEEYHWNGCWGDGEERFNDEACHIRNFIKDAYTNWGIEYVLLGGDVDQVPARRLWFLDINDVDNSTASDLYFACLDGNYNNNAVGDHADFWGETSDGDFDYGDNIPEPPGGGAYYAKAESENNFDAGFFTPPIDLSGYNTADLIFSKIFPHGSTPQGSYWAVRIYSGGTSASTSDFEEELINESAEDEDGHIIELTLDPINYTDSSKVYIEFHFFNNGAGIECGWFCIDEVIVEVPDGEYTEEIFFESFEGDVFPPQDWDRIKYSSGDNWRRQRYDDNLDLIAEVYVGRAPVDDDGEVDNFVTKTIEYELSSENDNYISNVLWLGSRLESENFGGSTAKAHKIEMLEYPCNNHGYQTYGIPTDNDEFTVDTLYDEGIPDTSKGWVAEDLIAKINNQYQRVHLINHLGHGHYRVNYKPHHSYFCKSYWKEEKNKWFVFDYFNYDNCNQLENGNNYKYFFMYSQACFAGYFDLDEFDVLAEFFTVKNPHGAFAVIMNSASGIMDKVTTNGWSQRFDREFWDAIFGENKKELGKANQDSKEDNLNFLKMEEYYGDSTPNYYSRRCYYQLNLFGDPSVKIKYPEDNNPPVIPSTPVYYSHSGQTYTIQTNTTDPDGDQVSYKWKINDEEFTYWTKYYNSSEDVYQTMVLLPGKHQIRVKSRDTNLNESNWSYPMEIEVPFSPSFHSESTTIILGNTINFYGTASGGMEPYNSWYYDFGDGNFSEQQNTTHTYDTLGNFSVTMNVTDDQNITCNITQVISVVILKADFETSQGFSITDQTINFNDTSKGFYDIINWSWDFDDSNTSYDQNTTHTFTSEGTYIVTLTVTDNQSNTDIHNQFFYVDETSSEINSVSKNYDTIGFESNITITADVTDTISGVKTVKINITNPESYIGNYTMTNTNGSNYEYTFSDSSKLGDYDFIIWTMDNANNTNISTENSFTVSRIFGYNNIGNSNQSISHTITGSVFTMHENGVADNITVYIDPGNATTDSHYQCNIYRHDTAKLVGISEEKNVSFGKGWQKFNFSVPKPVLLNNTKYVLSCWSDNYSICMYYDNGTGSEMYNDTGNSILQGHYFEGIYNYTPDTNNFRHEDRKYSIYCNYTPDTTPPEITNVSDNPDTAGFGFNVTITVDITDNASGVEVVKVNITYPDNSWSNYSMSNTGNDTFEYVFTDTWLVGQYNYNIWVNDYMNNSNSSSGHCFNVSSQATISVCTIKDNYGDNGTVNLTDPPGEKPLIGYELLDDDQVLHMWNEYNSYYFNASNGIQLTNHKDEYWTHNVLMLGYYDNDVWNLIYRTDELSGFTKNVTSDNETFVNATLWKNLNYQGYDFRLAIRYYLGVDDIDLTVIPYIKNIDTEDIPYILGFGWEMKDIRIANVTNDNILRIYNGTNFEDIQLNQTLDNSYANLGNHTIIRLICTNPPTYHLIRDLYLSWNKNLTYKVIVKSQTGQYNAPVTLFIRIGTLSADQVKSTMLHWLDSDDWLGISSSEYDSHCGDSSGHTLEEALDGTDYWYHQTNHDHHFVLDLGQTYTIKKVRGRSLRGSDPIDVDIYVSDNKSDWGTTVLTGISSWQDTDSWQDVSLSKYKQGRYIKVEVIDTEHFLRFIEWGSGFGPPYMTIFDVYAGVEPISNNPYPANGSIGIVISPTLNITVSDADGDLMNITWLSNSSGSWEVFGTNISVGNGTYHQTFSNASVNGQWWYWKVNVSDEDGYNVSDVFKFYTGYQSKIVNTGSTNISGYLLIQVQYFNTTISNWTLANDTINETTMRTINSSEQLGLDTVFNGLVNTSNLLDSFGSGTYRIYAAFRDPGGDVLVCDDETLLETTYEFTITSS
jgi:PKD repeat protein